MVSDVAPTFAYRFLTPRGLEVNKMSEEAEDDESASTVELCLSVSAEDPELAQLVLKANGVVARFPGSARWLMVALGAIIYTICQGIP